MTGDRDPGTAAPGPAGSGPIVPERVIALALEFAVGIAAAGVKHKAPLAVPAGLRPFLKVQRLPATALGKVRDIVEADPTFRAAVARAAKVAPEMLDEASLLWLTRPDGWQQRVTEIADAGEPADLAAELRRSERRREAAERTAHRVLGELAAVRAELDRQGDASTISRRDVERLQAEIVAARDEAARHRAAALKAQGQADAERVRADRSIAERDDAVGRAADAVRVRDEVLRSRATGEQRPADRLTERAVLDGAAAVAVELEVQSQLARRLSVELERLTNRLHQLEPSIRPPNVPERPRLVRQGKLPAGRVGRRRPIGVPGGLYGSSLAAAEHVVRHAGAVVFVDGYNVAKLRFPRLDLAMQRERCIDLCEDMARRWGTDIVVVFDGTSGSGVAGTSRRLVRVTYSPEGVIADDVIRAEVAALPDEVPVVVVTNDQAVIADVRAMGANPLSSDLFLELATR